jgi:hypothetical protein
VLGTHENKTFSKKEKVVFCTLENVEFSKIDCNALSN